MNPYSNVLGNLVNGYKGNTNSTNMNGTNINNTNINSTNTDPDPNGSHSSGSISSHGSPGQLHHLQSPLQSQHLDSRTPIHPNGARKSIPNSEEDERFFKLAKEAIVATAKATSRTSNNNKQILDPTLNDLFMRLQYVSSPHGNPIKNGENIQVNEKGQLMIQDFYQNFPNLDNDIFQDPTRVGSSNDTTSYWRSGAGSNSNSHRNPLIGANPLAGVTAIPEKGESNEPRKYQCLKCSMNFKRSSDLKRHEKQHLSIPPNICEFCGKGFARKDALKRHVGTATCKRNAEKKLYLDNLLLLQ